MTYLQDSTDTQASFANSMFFFGDPHFSQNKPRQGIFKSLLVFSGRPPCFLCCPQVRTAWVPQLQMHCLASGAPSALLLSRSATKGVRLFRVYRCALIPMPLAPYRFWRLAMVRQRGKEGKSRVARCEFEQKSGNDREIQH